VPKTTITVYIPRKEVMQYKISLVVEDTKLGDIVALLAQEGTQLHVEPILGTEASPVEKPSTKRQSRKRNAPYLKARTVTLMMEHLKSKTDAESSVSALQACFESHGYSASTVTPTLSNLAFLEVIQRNPDGKRVRLLPSSNWRHNADTLTDGELRTLRAEASSGRNG
jgi:hypothetical protein